MPHLAAARPAAVASSADPDPRRAGLLAAAEAASACGRESIRSVLVFASGSHATATVRVARGAAEHLPDATVLVLGGAGVVSPEGETEGATAVTALTLGAPLHAAVAEGPKPAPDAASLGRMLGEAVAHERRRPMLFFCQPHVFGPELLPAFAEASRAQVVAGGGVAAEGRLAVYEPGRDVRNGVALAVRIDGGMRLAVGVSPGVAKLGEPRLVEEIREGFVEKLGGRRPLDVLSEAVSGRSDRPLVLAAIVPRDADPEGPSRFLVRAISGVDPTRGAVHVEEVREGDRMAFAVLDPRAAREHLEATLRDVERGTAGGVPLAGLYFDCAGRGTRLYGRCGVDARILRNRLGGLPFAGMHSSFEIGPFGGEPRMHTFGGVFALLYAPS